MARGPTKADPILTHHSSLLCQQKGGQNGAWMAQIPSKATGKASPHPLLQEESPVQSANSPFLVLKE